MSNAPQAAGPSPLGEGSPSHPLPPQGEGQASLRERVAKELYRFSSEDWPENWDGANQDGYYSEADRILALLPREVPEEYTPAEEGEPSKAGFQEFDECGRPLSFYAKRFHKIVMVDPDAREVPASSEGAMLETAVRNFLHAWKTDGRIFNAVTGLENVIHVIDYPPEPQSKEIPE